MPMSALSSASKSAAASGTAMPAPVTVVVFGPAVWFPLIVMAPPYAVTAVGVNDTVTVCDPPAGMTPPDQLPEKPAGYAMLFTVSGALPALLTISEQIG